MEKYYVNVHYDVVVHEEVYANSEDEAIDLAVEQASTRNLNEADAFDGESCVTDHEEISLEDTKSVLFTELKFERPNETEEEVLSAIDKYLEENPECLEDETTIEDIVFNIGLEMDEERGLN